jgi:hypothetical protein
LVSKTGTRISSNLIRSIPLKQLLDRDVEGQMKIREQAPETIKFVKDNFGNKRSNALVATEHPKLKRSSKSQKTSASQLKEIELQMVALAWHDNNNKHATRPSAKHISQVTKISRTLIRTRISECRKLGLIPPSSHGNATVNGKTKKGPKR